MSVSRKRSKPLTDEQVNYRRNLVVHAQNGNMKAFNEFRRLNRGLFEKVIKTYAPYVMEKDRDDLRQEGEMGYMKGIMKYDASKGKKKPEGYVFAWVRAYVADYARKHGIGESSKTESNHATFADPRGSKVDRESNIYDNVIELPWLQREPTPEERLDEQQTLAMYHKAAENLLPKEREVAARRIFSEDPETLTVIGDDMGVSRERVRQIELEVKRKMKKRLEQMAASA